MKTKLTIAGIFIAAIFVVVWQFMIKGASGLTAGLKAANDSIDKSKERISGLKKKRTEEENKIRGASEEDSVDTLNSLDRD